MLPTASPDLGKLGWFITHGPQPQSRLTGTSPTPLHTPTHYIDIVMAHPATTIVTQKHILTSPYHHPINRPSTAASPSETTQLTRTSSPRHTSTAQYIVRRPSSTTTDPRVIMQPFLKFMTTFTLLFILLRSLKSMLQHLVDQPPGGVNAVEGSIIPFIIAFPGAIYFLFYPHIYCSTTLNGLSTPRKSHVVVLCPPGPKIRRNKRIFDTTPIYSGRPSLFAGEIRNPANTSIF